MPSVLIIDADQFQRDVLENMVRTLGYEPRVFATMQEAGRYLSMPVSAPVKHYRELSLHPQDYAGYSSVWLQILHSASMAANTLETLIIEGEAGTGKFTLACALHHHSTRAAQPLVFAETSQDLTLLHTRAAAAAGGTLVVCHHGRAPEAFLRGIERLCRTFMTPHTKLVLCRQIDLHDEPLPNHYPISHLHIPPLRTRPQDTLLLAESFLLHARSWLNSGVLHLSPATKDAIATYHWPGNIRQLHAELFNAALHSSTGEVVMTIGFGNSERYAPAQAAFNNDQRAPASPFISMVDEEGNLRSLEDIEAEIIQFALTHFQTSRSDIARMLGIGRTTLYRKAHQLHS